MQKKQSNENHPRRARALPTTHSHPHQQLNYSGHDCIMPDMSSIVCQKKGMTNQAAYAQASTMGNLNRQVRVATGTSIETYCHDPGQPSLPGEGQGNADSMALWTLMISRVYNNFDQD
jgi:hypothetical protein